MKLFFLVMLGTAAAVWVLWPTVTIFAGLPILPSAYGAGTSAGTPASA